MATKKRRTARMKWKNFGFVPEGCDDSQMVKYRDDGFLYLCRELRNDSLNFYKHRYSIRDRKFRPGQGGRNMSTDWTGLDDAIFKEGPKLSLPSLSCPLRPRNMTAEEKEEAGRTAYLNWIAVKAQQQAGNDPADESKFRPWEELSGDEKDTFLKAGESLATPEIVMWDIIAQMRKRMGEKAFRRKLFELTLPIAIQRMLPDMSEAERHYVTDHVLKLSEMLDVPPEQAGQ